MKRMLLRCGLLLSFGLPAATRAQSPLPPGQLDTVTVRARGEARRLHRSQYETVLGYDFLGDSLVVVTAGDRYKPGRLLLLAPTGTTVSSLPLTWAAEGLFALCTGELNLLLDSSFCPVLLAPDGGLRLGEPEPRSLLAPLADCECAVGNRLYLRHRDPQAFQVSYGYRQAGDSAFRPLYAAKDAESARSSWEDIQEALLVLETTLDFAEFARILRRRALLNNLAFRALDTRLLFAADTPVVADMTRGQFRFFAPDGTAGAAVPMQFDRGLLHSFRFVRDEVTGRYYLHRFGNTARQTLQALNLDTGAPFGPVVELQRSGAVQVRVHQGRIYYLWQAGQGGETRGLYVQPGFGDA